MSDSHKFSFLQWLRLITWEGIQSLVGLISIIGIGGLFSIYKFRRNLTGIVGETSIKKGAFSLGPVILGPRGLTPDFRDHLYIHETGHSYQSRLLGPFYLFLIGIPSLISAWIMPRHHNQRWYEVWANKLAIKHAMIHFPAFDMESYVTPGKCSKYQNPRNGGYNIGGNPIVYEFKWYDILLLIPGMTCIVFLIWLISQWICT